MNYDEVMQADNHNQSYFKFRDSFSILCNDSIDFSNFATLIETLSDENIIGNYYDADIETLFMMTSIEYSYLSSSSVKQVGKFGGDISGLVPREIVDVVKTRLK